MHNTTDLHVQDHMQIHMHKSSKVSFGWQLTHELWQLIIATEHHHPVSDGTRKQAIEDIFESFEVLSSTSAHSTQPWTEDLSTKFAERPKRRPEQSAKTRIGTSDGRCVRKSKPNEEKLNAFGTN